MISSRILDIGDEDGQTVWQNLKPTATKLREIYGKPAEEVIRWQRVIQKYQDRLQNLTVKDKTMPSELKTELEAIVS